MASNYSLDKDDQLNEGEAGEPGSGLIGFNAVQNNSQIRCLKGSLCILLFTTIILTIIFSFLIHHLFTMLYRTQSQLEAQSANILQKNLFQMYQTTDTTKEPVPKIPQNSPSEIPSNSPSEMPSNSPSEMPSNSPSEIPSNSPSEIPSNSPSEIPSNSPSQIPSTSPSEITNYPTKIPSEIPSNSNCCNNYVGDYKVSFESKSHGHWLLCDGSFLDSRNYTELFDVIKYIFGNKTSETEYVRSGNDYDLLKRFALPNAKGRVIAMNDGYKYRNGDALGQSTITLNVGHIPSHSHEYNQYTETYSKTYSDKYYKTYSDKYYVAYTVALNTTKAGKGSSFELYQPTIVIGNLFIYAGDK